MKKSDEGLHRGSRICVGSRIRGQRADETADDADANLSGWGCGVEGVHPKFWLIRHRQSTADAQNLPVRTLVLLH